MAFDTTLAAACARLGIALPDGAMEKYTIIYQKLCEANQVMNLTRIVEPDAAALGHFADSLVPLALWNLPQNARCIGVGVGAGFPDIPLAVCRGDIEYTCVDSVNKKLGFVRAMAEEFALPMTAVHGRCEDLGHSEHREAYDICLARAVAALPVLCELCLPFVKLGGHFLAWKGPGAGEELAAAEKALDALGASLAADVPYRLSDADEVRHLLVFEKIRQTPQAFPRRGDAVRKKPIGSAK